jgi:hypothetical protein
MSLDLLRPFVRNRCPGQVTDASLSRVAPVGQPGPATAPPRSIGNTVERIIRFLLFPQHPGGAVALCNQTRDFQGASIEMFNLEAISRRERRRSWPLAMGRFAPQAAMAQVETPA